MKRKNRILYLSVGCLIKLLAGRIYDQTHSYFGSLLLLLGAVLLSFGLSFLIRRPKS